MELYGPKSRGGFTLVEVLVVAAVIALAGAIVVPHIVHSGQMGSQAAARALMQDMLVAQNEAIANQAPRRIVFEQSLNRYRLTDENGVTLGVSWKGDGGTENYVVDFSADSRFAGVQLINVSVGPNAYIEYDDLGTPSTGGYVELTGGANAHYRINVAPITGRVSIAPVTSP